MIELIQLMYATAAGATAPEIASAEAHFGVRFPPDYVALLLSTDGGGIEVADGIVEFWRVEKLVKLNTDYEIRLWLPELVAIGTDGGGKCYALRYDEPRVAPTFVRVPLGDLDRESIVKVGTTVSEGLQLLRSGEAV